MKSRLSLLLVALLAGVDLHAQTPQFGVPVTINPDQSITYNPTPKGDRIPDFSTVGWNYGNSPLPNSPGGYEVPVLVTLSPGTGDQTDRIQAAIDFIATKPLVNGFRGTLLLKAGRWDIHSINRLYVRSSGIVIRGEGDNPLNGTRLHAIGTINENGGSTLPRSPLITFQGGSNSVNASARTLVDAVYVPSGVNVIPVTGHPFAVGQRVQVRWPGSVAWQKASLFKTDATTDLDPAVTHNRVITAVTANSITLDAPITTPLDPVWGRAYVVPVTALNHITNVGISHIYMESAYAHDTDETHAINAVYFNLVEDGFMHNCTARHFAYAVANVSQNTRKITVDRSQYLDGISRLIGARRYSFLLSGELGLVSNSISRYGRHAFVSSWPGIPGPVVFLDSVAIGSYNESGAHLDWNNGGLWDNITDGKLQVKLERPSASSVAWNCILGSITFENMPFTPNWALGNTKSGGGAPAWINSVSGGAYAYTAPHLGKAELWSNGTRMAVRSLYENQLNTRLAAAGNPHRYAANPATRIPYPPTIRTPAQLIALSGSAFSYQVPVSNLVPATRTPNFTATGLPPGLSINATTGLVSGTLPAVVSETNYAVTFSARNIDGTTTRAMTLTVRPVGSPKVPLAMSLEVDINRTTTIAVRAGLSAAPVPMVPSSRLLAPMIVRKAYISDYDGSAYTTSDIPVPVRGVLPIEGLTSPINVTYNGSATLPTAPGYYDVVATLDDPIYSASATGRLLITNANAVTVTLGNTTAPTAASPVTATSTQPSLTPVITYDGSSAFPTASGLYAAKAVVADPTYFGSRLALIGIPPQLSQQPVSLTVIQGAPATFTVTASGIAPTYQWRKNGVAIPGATGTSFSIPSTQGSDTGTYDVVVTDQSGVTTSAPATLVVVVPPQITQPPASVSVAVNTPATFSVTASGGALSHQWRKGGNPIPGATSASFTIPSAQTTDAANYDVVVTNSQGTVTSSAATLTVVVPPQITQPPQSLTVNQGAPATFSVTATGIANTYQWRKGGTAIPGATGTTFTISSAQASDAANYDVVVTNIAAPLTTSAATLTVIVPPQITQAPVSQIVTLGSQATFSVTASGLSLEYQWRKNGQPIPGATNPSYTIASVQAGDTGLYDVVVTNPAGSATSASASLSPLNSSGILKLNNTTALDLTGSWTGGTVPGPMDTASWNGTYTSGSVSVGSGLSAGRIQLLSPSTAITLNTGTGPLTLGGGGFDLSASSQSLTVNTPVTLAAHQTWTIAASRNLFLNSAVSDGGAGLGVTVSGSGGVVLAANNTYSGPTILTGGTLHIGPSAGGTSGSVAGPVTVIGGTLRSNRLDAHSPFGGLFSASAGSLQINYASGNLTLNSTNLPAGSTATLTSVSGASGATLCIDAAPTASLTFGSSTAGLNILLRRGLVTFTTNGGASNLRIEGGTLTSTPADRFQLSTANQTFTVTGGTVDLRAGVSFGFRLGGSGSATQAGAQNVTGSQSGGTVLAAFMSIGGTDTDAVKRPSYSLSGGTLSLNSGLTLGADSGGNGTAAFSLSGGTLLVPGTLSGGQSGARQIFSMTGGTLAAATLTFTNLRSSDLAGNGTFSQSGGILAPGDVGTPGRTTVNGAYTLGTNATLALDLGGNTTATAFQGAASQFDNLVVTGTTALSGNLSISLVNGFTPANTATFTVLSSTGTLSGAFANVPFGSRIVTAGSEGSFLVSQSGNNVTLSAFLPVVIVPFVTPGNTSYALDWTGSTAVTYDLDRALSANGPFTRLATGLTATTYTDTTAVAGTQYFYRLTGTDVLGRTTVATTSPPPATPAGLAATPGFTTNALSWSSVSGATGYRVRRALSESGPFVIVASPTSASFTDTALTTGVAYYYAVTALNASGESASSGVVVATPVAGTATKANNTNALDIGSSWSTGTVPTLFDNALWNGTYANSTVSIGGGLSIAQLRLTSPSQAVVINAGTGPLALGSGGLDLSASTQNLTIGAPIVLADSQTWAVNAGRTLTVSGDISESDAETTLTKSGAGTLVLGGSGNSWTGATLVSAGTLQLDAGGVIGFLSSVGVASGATLSGTGTVQGPLTINGNLTPGLNGAGTLSLRDSLTLASSSTTTFSIHRVTPSANSAISGATSVTFGGTLVVTNAGPALAAGDRFVLFTASAYGGTFSTVTLPALDAGLVWDVSGLPIDGSLLVRASSATASAKYWDTSATAGLQGGSGAWDSAATTNWNPAADGSGNRTVFWHFDSVSFQNGGANTLTLSAPVAVSALTQSGNGTSTTLTGGALVLGGPVSNGLPTGNASLSVQAPVRLNNLAITVTAAQPILFGQGLDGSGNLTKSGNSTLIITGDSSWSGALTLDGGTTRFEGATPGLSSVIYGSAVAAASNSTLQFTRDAELSSLTVRNLGSNSLELSGNASLVVTGPAVLGLNGNSANITANTTTSITFTGGGSAWFNNPAGNFIVAGGNKGGIVTADFSGLSSLVIDSGPSGNAFLGTNLSVTSDILRFAPDTVLTAANLYIGDANTGGTYTLVLGSGDNVLNLDNIYIGQRPGVSNRSDGSVTFPAGSTNATVRLRAADGSGRANLLLNDNSSTTGRLLTTTFDVSARSADLLLNNLVVGRRNASSSAAQVTADTFRWDRGTLDVLQQVVLCQAPAAAQKTHVASMTLGSANSTSSDTAIFRGGILIAENRSTVATAGASAQASLTIAGGSITSAGITLGDLSAGGNSTRQSLAILNLTGGSLSLTAPLRSGATGGPGNETTTLTLNGGTLDLGGNALGGNGSAAITTLNFQSGTLANVGSINGSSGVTKTGNGTLTLAGNNTFTGPVTVSAGTLVLAPSVSLTTSVSVASGATLIPNGSLGGNLTVPVGATVRFRVDSATSFDQLTLTGPNSTATLGAALDIVAAPDLPPGTRFRILRNEGNPAAPVIGTFASRPQRTAFTASGRTWYLDYAAGSGGDVDLVLASTLELWRQTHFGSLFATGNALDSADPDGDSVANLLEYALGTDPTSAASRPSLDAQVSAQRLQLSFLRARSDLIYIVEASSALSGWTTIATNPGAVGETVIVRDTVDLTSQPNTRRFLRLRVQSP